MRQTLIRMSRECTTLVIAHRYSMVQDADRVFVLEAGRIVEAGKPAELLARDGWFARFARSSLSEVREEVAQSGEAVNCTDIPPLAFPTKAANQ